MAITRWKSIYLNVCNRATYNEKSWFGMMVNTVYHDLNLPLNDPDCILHLHRNEGPAEILHRTQGQPVLRNWWQMGEQFEDSRFLIPRLGPLTTGRWG